LRWWLIVICLGLAYLLGEAETLANTISTAMLTPQNFNDQGENNIHNSSSWFDQKPRAILLLGMILGTIVIR
jgi:hypothetical protein